MADKKSGAKKTARKPVASKTTPRLAGNHNETFVRNKVKKSAPKSTTRKPMASKTTPRLSTNHNDSVVRDRKS